MKEVFTMKKIVKALSIILTLCILAFSFAACTNTETKETTKAGETPKLKVGVIQFVSHPSLDNCYKGILQGIEKSGYKDKVDIDFQNGNGSDETISSIAKNMVAKKYDMIIAIATPAAVPAYSAAKDTNIPVIFSAVSDPVAAGLVETLDIPNSNCTGTSDILDLSAQLDLIKAFQPNVKKVGILYTTSEANSVSQLAKMKSIAKDYDVEIVASGIQNASEVSQAAVNLASKVDCINNFTDNNVVNNLSLVLEAANNAGIPVYGSEEEQVKNGCLGSVGIDYVALGEVTGEMAVKVLSGSESSKMAVEKITDVTPLVNTDVLSKLKLQIPDSYKNIEKTQTHK